MNILEEMAYWHTPAIPALGRWKQKQQEVKQTEGKFGLLETGMNECRKEARK